MSHFISYVVSDWRGERLVSHYGTESEVAEMLDHLPGNAEFLVYGETLSMSVAPLDEEGDR